MDENVENKDSEIRKEKLEPKKDKVGVAPTIPHGDIISHEADQSKEKKESGV